MTCLKLYGWAMAKLSSLLFNFVFQDSNGLLLVVRQKRVITRETREVGGRRCPLEKRETRAIRDDLARRRYK